MKVKISFNEYLDETTQQCNYVIPSHHFLESWGDAEPKSGYTSFIQPTIHPLFKTRAFQTSLLKWSGNNTDYETYFKNYWETKLGSKTAFDAALQKGLIESAVESGYGYWHLIMHQLKPLLLPYQEQRKVEKLN